MSASLIFVDTEFYTANAKTINDFFILPMFLYHNPDQPSLIPPRVLEHSGLDTCKSWCLQCPVFASRLPGSDGSFRRRKWIKPDSSPSPATLQLDAVRVPLHLLLSAYLGVYAAGSGQASSPSSIASFMSSSGWDSSGSTPESSQDSSMSGSTYTAHLQRQPRIRVSSRLEDPSSRTYHLEVIQHPERTAEFGQNYLSRLPLTPPIIVRLTVRDSSGNSVVPLNAISEAELPFLIAHLSLFSDNGLTSLDIGSSIGSLPPLLYGNLVSSINQLEDLQGNLGLFFIFSDVSIRWQGKFQLGITVTKISRIDSFGGMGVSDHGIILAETRTRSFDVLPYAQYIAVPHTLLTTSFIRQGARILTFMSQNI